MDSDAGGHHAGGLLNWLGLSTGLPVLVWLTSFLACFSFVGLAVQQVSEVVTGQPLHWAVACGAALVLGSVFNSFAALGLTRIFPEFESTAINAEALLRRRGIVLEGTARRGFPARAKVVDHHGQAHYVMVEPHNDIDEIAQGQTALLVRREGSVFFVLPDASTPFSSV
jgi:hypothetical protein